MPKTYILQPQYADNWSFGTSIYTEKICILIYVLWWRPKVGFTTIWNRKLLSFHGFNSRARAIINNFIKFYVFSDTLKTVYFRNTRLFLNIFFKKSLAHLHELFCLSITISEWMGLYNRTVVGILRLTLISKFKIVLIQMCHSVQSNMEKLS